jgi:photosystem II stability/assembly factor-like uncharacterized protein
VLLIRNRTEGNPVDNLYPVSSFSHAHGLAVDSANPTKLYIATHQGLFVLINDKDLYRIGASQDDYMGFTPHPALANIFFTSGHPRFGGNLGFQKSEDGGHTWKKISDGANGPADFHAMTISPADTDLVYGWYRGLQRSVDGGKLWETLNTSLSRVIALFTDPQDQNRVFAATVEGLKVSKDKGLSWNTLTTLPAGVLTALAINPQENQKMLAFSDKAKLMQTNDGGISWQAVNENFGGEMVLYLAPSKQDPKTVYALTDNNKIYKSIDAGNSWNKIY